MNTDIVTSEAYALRPIQTGDEEFLYRVYASTRTDEMKLVDWTDEQKTAFLHMQFNAQTEHYHLHYPTAEYFVILHDGVAVGRLTLEHSQQALLVMDLILLEEYRRTGIGTAVLKNLMEEARRAALPVVLRVEFFNPVISLYTRLGFVKTREINSVYHEMVWTPASD